MQLMAFIAYQCVLCTLIGATFTNKIWSGESDNCRGTTRIPSRSICYRPHWVRKFLAPTTGQFDVLWLMKLYFGLANWIFSLFQTRILQAKAGRKIQFNLGKNSSSSDSIFQSGELQKSSADR